MNVLSSGQLGTEIWNSDRTGPQAAAETTLLLPRKEGGKEGRKEGRKGGREGERKEGREEGRKREREEGRKSYARGRQHPGWTDRQAGGHRASRVTLLWVTVSSVSRPDQREWQPRVFSLSSRHPRPNARHQGQSPSPLWISWALLGLGHCTNVI